MRQRTEGSDVAAPLRVVIAHDYITQRGGAERVVLALSRIFPDAPIHTLLYNPSTTFPEFADRTIVVSPLNRVGLFRRFHRLALPLLAQASSRMTIDADVVIASSSGWAHGFPTSGAKYVYCHSPARWLYAADDYFGGESRRSIAGAALTLLKRPLLGWDARAARTADRYVANSHVIKDRIKRAYGIDAEVLPPPFGVDGAGETAPIAEAENWVRDGGSYYLVVSRLMPYKNVDKVIDAVRGRGAKLLVIGDGPMKDALDASRPENVAIVSGVSDAELRWAYANCTALIAASYEDFGLTPLEAGSFGKPVVALHAGGYLDTVVDGVSGVFFERAEPDDIAEGIESAAQVQWDADAIRAHASSFDEAHFAERLRGHIAQLVGGLPAE